MILHGTNPDNDLVELCYAVIVTGAEAFRGTGDTSTKCDTGFLEEEEEAVYEEQVVHEEQAMSEEPAVSEDWDIEEPIVCLFCWLVVSTCTVS